MLGEASTTEIARNKDAQGYVENCTAAVEGGSVAGRARRDLEKKSGKRIASKANYKQLPEAAARKKVTQESDARKMNRTRSRRGKQEGFIDPAPHGTTLSLATPMFAECSIYNLINGYCRFLDRQ